MGSASSSPASASASENETKPDPFDVAIATVHDGTERYRCAMPLWCLSATALTKVIPRSRIVLFGEPSEDCPTALRLWGTVGRETAAAAEAYLKRTAIGGSWSYLRRPALLKLGILGLTRFQLILYVDLDADMQPQWNPVGAHKAAPLSRAQWATSYRHLMDSKALFVATPDHASPVNTGVWLLKPRRYLYDEAIRLLHTANFSAHDGFDHAGTPHTLASDEAQLSRLTSGKDDQTASMTTAMATKAKLDQTDFVKLRTWLFVGGNIDQGLFWYLFFVRFVVGTWASEAAAPWRVHHFWGPGKPWERAGHARAFYLQRLHAYLQRPELRQIPNGTTCARQLRAAWADLVRRNLTRVDDSTGWTPHSSPVLPSARIRSFEPKGDERRLVARMQAVGQQLSEFATRAADRTISLSPLGLRVRSTR